MKIFQMTKRNYTYCGQLTTRAFIFKINTFVHMFIPSRLSVVWFYLFYLTLFLRLLTSLCTLTSPLRGNSFNSEYHTIVQLINRKRLLDSRVDRYLSCPGPPRRADSHAPRSTDLLGPMLTWRTKRLRRPCHLAFVTHHSHSRTSCDICKCSPVAAIQPRLPKRPFRELF